MKVIPISTLYLRAGRGPLTPRDQFRRGDAVVISASGAIGVVDTFITEGPSCGKVKVFVRGNIRVVDQDAIERQGVAPAVCVG